MYIIIRTIQNSNRKIVGKEAKARPLSHIYMTAHIPVLTQQMVVGLI
jgi:hypothetical protein